MTGLKIVDRSWEYGPISVGCSWLSAWDAEIVPVTKGIPDAASYYRLFPLMAVLWPVVYYFYGLYQVRRNRSRVR